MTMSEGKIMSSALETKLEREGWDGLDMCTEEIVDKGCWIERCQAGEKEEEACGCDEEGNAEGWCDKGEWQD